MANLDELEQWVTELKKVRVFNDDVNKATKEILAQIPSPEEERNPSAKARLFSLRGRTAMLLPRVSKEAEKDLNAALKLEPGSVDTWVELAECLLRRNAFKEACDALDSALRINPTHTQALCKYSQIQRNRCGSGKVTPEERKKYIDDSAEKARAAVRCAVDNADAWNTLSLSLLGKVMLEGVTFDGVRKALAAMRQAANKASDDPDVLYNMAVLDGLLGHFGEAATHYWLAYELDKDRLRSARRQSEAYMNVLIRTQNRMRVSSAIGKREFKKICTRVETSEKKYSTGTPVNVVGVVDVVTDTSTQPIALLVSNMAGEFSYVLLHGIGSTVFKIGDVVAYPKSAPSNVICHSVKACPALSVDAFEVSLPHVHPDPRGILVNGQPLPPSAFVPLQMSSRLFA